MWQRFTERARKVIYYAQEEAARLGQTTVGPEHILLGLVRENDSVSARLLGLLDVKLKDVRSAVERVANRGSGGRAEDMTLTDPSKRVIDLAYDEARNFNNNYIGTEHLLLGVIRESTSLAGQALADLGVTLERVRAEVVFLQIGSAPPADSVWPPPPRKPASTTTSTLVIDDEAAALFAATEALVKANSEPRGRGEHVLYTLLENEHDPACKLLVALGCSPAALRDSAGAKIDWPESGVQALVRRVFGSLQRRKRGDLIEVFRTAQGEARALGENTVSTVHVLLALASAAGGSAASILRENGVTHDALLSAAAGSPPTDGAL